LDRGGPGGAVRVGVFIRIEDDDALARLRSAGATTGTRVGDIVTARLPLDALDMAASMTGIRTMQVSRRVELDHDRSREAVNVDDVRSRIGGTWTGTAGQGVIVGVYDTGLDYTHHDFRDPGGGTRLL
ncbi:MAG: hypothetical protein GWM90_27800, partial [Gemmatimonadetes bacterium]|nr:hypothetical protein [Gemmatimonadota bacterium]NIQ58816.1 hypothetical protein [Gemmatimonadota bacterium]NIU78987.1 hypothetical protein [Gammaproteobacteria bacterium]NIX47733.1 hypothetical protein [Gemmatimonadota bacterium]